VHLSSVPVRIETDEGRMRPNDVPVFQGNATRIRTELGWVSRIKVEQTLRDTLDWWRGEVRAGR
jgi:GDP-4-dehydro-6-deoxy-D-mannose reductase